MKECIKCEVELTEDVITDKEGTTCMSCIYADAKADASKEIMHYVSIIISVVAFGITWYLAGYGLLVEFYGAQFFFEYDRLADMIVAGIMCLVAIGFAIFAIPKERKTLKTVSILLAILSLTASLILF